MRSLPTLTMYLIDALLALLIFGATTGVGEVGQAEETPAVKPLPPSLVSKAEAESLVAYHDAVRNEVGVGPVVWSADIAAFAQQWADHIAATGKFEHRPFEVEKSETAAVDAADELPKQIYGENLAIGNNPGFSAVDGARSWYEEKKDYVPGTPISTDFSQFKAGHYTQMVWNKTTKIGAGKAIVQTGEFKGWTVIVCNYSPGGNEEGLKPFESQK